MNIIYFGILRKLIRRYKKNTRDLLKCLDDIKNISYKKNVTIKKILLNHDLEHIIKQIDKYCVKKEKYLEHQHKDFDDALFDFFILEINCPKNFKNCEKLREIYTDKLNKLTSSKDCTNCSINLFKLYFIKNYLEKNYISVKGNN